MVVNAKQLLNVGRSNEDAAEGQQRFNWVYEVEVGNASSIQKDDALSKNVLAGLLVHTALRFSVPNLIVVGRYLRKSTAATLESMGLKFDESSDFLRQVELLYQFRPWADIIVEAKQGYSEAMDAFAELRGEDPNWRVIKYKEVEEAFIGEMNQKMVRASKELQGLQIAEETLKNKLYTRTDGWMVQLAKEQKNFMQWVIDDSIKRRFPSKGKASKELEKQISEARKKFSLKDYKEQLDYYWGRPEFERPMRCPNFMDPEMLGFLRRNAQQLDITLSQASLSYEEALDAIKLARAKLFYRFPQLKNEDAWKTYKGENFASVMGKFWALSLKATNEVLALETSEEVINYFATNANLFDIVLRTYPDQKLQICRAQWWNKALDNTIKYGVDGAMIVGTGMAFFPVTAPVGVAVDVAAAGVSGLRAWKKAREAAQAEQMNFALSAQSTEQFVHQGDYYQRQLEIESDLAFSQFVSSGIAAGIGAGFSVPAVWRSMRSMPAMRLWPKLLGQTSRAAATRSWRLTVSGAEAIAEASVALDRTILRALGRSEEAIAAAAARSGETLSVNLPGGASRLVRNWETVRHAIAKPFMELKLIERWSEASFFENFFPYLSFFRRSAAEQASKRYLADELIQAGGDGLVFHALYHGSFVGAALRFGPGVLGYRLTKVANRLLLAGMLTPLAGVTYHFYQASRERAVLLLFSRLRAERERYQWAIDLMLDGGMNFNDVLETVQMDESVANLYHQIKLKVESDDFKKMTADERSKYLAELEKVDKVLELGLQTETNPNRRRLKEHHREDINETLQIYGAKGVYQ